MMHVFSDEEVTNGSTTFNLVDGLPARTMPLAVEALAKDGKFVSARLMLPKGVNLAADWAITRDGQVFNHGNDKSTGGVFVYVMEIYAPGDDTGWALVNIDKKNHILRGNWTFKQLETVAERKANVEAAVLDDEVQTPASTVDKMAEVLRGHKVPKRPLGHDSAPYTYKPTTKLPGEAARSPGFEISSHPGPAVKAPKFAVEVEYGQSMLVSPDPAKPNPVDAQRAAHAPTREAIYQDLSDDSEHDAVYEGARGPGKTEQLSKGPGEVAATPEFDATMQDVKDMMKKSEKPTEVEILRENNFATHDRNTRLHSTVYKLLGGTMDSDDLYALRNEYGFQGEVPATDQTEIGKLKGYNTELADKNIALRTQYKRQHDRHEKHVVDIRQEQSVDVNKMREFHVDQLLKRDDKIKLLNSRYKEKVELVTVLNLQIRTHDDELEASADKMGKMRSEYKEVMLAHDEEFARMSSDISSLGGKLAVEEAANKNAAALFVDRGDKITDMRRDMEKDADERVGHEEKIEELKESNVLLKNALKDYEASTEFYRTESASLKRRLKDVVAEARYSTVTGEDLGPKVGPGRKTTYKWYATQEELLRRREQGLLQGDADLITDAQKRKAGIETARKVSVDSLVDLLATHGYKADDIKEVAEDIGKANKAMDKIVPTMSVTAVAPRFVAQEDVWGKTGIFDNQERNWVDPTGAADLLNEYADESDD